MTTDVNDVPKTPMCEHLSEKREDLNLLQDFCNWLREQGLCICEQPVDDRMVSNPYAGTSKDLAYRFLGIDKEQLEEERRELLDYQRRLNK